MIPERLELVAFGPFVEPQVVDLARAGAHGLFLIHGPTGSGKSMLLDALTFALFGETSGSDRDGADLVSSQADGAEARVALEFRHAGARYRIERTPRQRRRKRRGEGFTDVNPTAALHRLADDGGTTLLTDGAAQVTARVRDLLKCDATQFRQTVVLPQGQFRRVIEDDDTRARTLADLFDTHRFARVQAQLKTHAAELRAQVQALLDELAALRAAHAAADAAAMAGLVAAAHERLAAAEAVARAADGRHAAAIEARTEGRTWAERFADLATAQDALARLAAASGAIDDDRRRLALDGAARDAEPAVRTWRQAERALEEREAATSAAQAGAAAALAHAERAGCDRAEHEALRAGRDDADALQRRLAPLAEDVGRLADAREAAERTGAAAAEADRAVAGLERERAEAEAARAEAEADAARLEPLAGDAADARAAEALSASTLAAHHGLLAVRQELADLEAADTGIDLEALWRPLSRALAARLEPGAPCPVCGATDHPAAAHRDDRASALAAAHEALASTQAAGLRAAEARARAEERFATALAAGGWTADAVPDRPSLETAREAARARLAAALQAVADLATRRADRDRAAARLAEVAPAVTEARLRQTAAREAAARAQATLEGLLDRLDPALHDPIAFRAELDGARAAVAAYDHEADRRLAATARADQDAAVADDRRVAAEGESDAARSRLDAARSEAEAALRGAGFVAAGPDGTTTTDPGAQAAALLESDLRAALSVRVREHDEAVTSMTTRRDTLAAATADRAPPDLDALEGAVAQAQAARDAAAAQRDDARDADRALESDERRWRELEARLGADEARQRAAQHLADLVSGTAKGHTKLDLETYVLRRILGDVLRHANVHLGRMTGGRFQLRLRDRADELRARGLELDVEDRHAGGARRRVATLSGGEGFQASLALALGLSEAAERTSGAVELGALFIDEGFGSLDTHALDGVVRILRQLPLTQRRTVGVITHVDELKRRIEAQVTVTRDALGSRVTQRG